MYKGIVFRIEELTKLGNSNKLQIVNFNGNSVIVDNSYQLNDLCIYFQPETKIHHWFLSERNLYRDTKLNINSEKMGFFEPNGRVKAIKLRGVLSQGFVYKPTQEEILDWNLIEYKEIDHINDNLLCEKYLTPSEIKVKRQNTYKQLEKKFDKRFSNQFKQLGETPQLVNVLHLISYNSKIILTLKLHGTSHRVGYLPIVSKWNWKELLKFNFKDFLLKNIYTIQTGSRRINLFSGTESNKQNGYYKSDFRYQLHKLFLTLPIFQNEIFYGEVVGYNGKSAIQKIENIDFSYGCNHGEYKFFIYKIVQNEKTLTYWEMVKRCKELNLLYVPILFETVFSDKKEFVNVITTLSKQIESNDPIGNHICEGFVATVYTENKEFKFKFKTDLFSEMEGIMRTTEKINIENIE